MSHMTTKRCGSYMEHALYRLEKTKIAFEHHRSIDSKLCRVSTNFQLSYGGGGPITSRLGVELVWFKVSPTIRIHSFFLDACLPSG